MEWRDHVYVTGGALKNWAVAQLQDSVVVGALWLVGLLILRVPLAFVWAPLAAIFQVIPHLGPVLGVVGPVAAAALHWGDWQHPLYVLILYAVIAVADGLFLQPYIMRRSTRVPIWASILTPLVLGTILPFWGIFLAPPLLAVIFAYKNRFDTGRMFRT